MKDRSFLRLLVGGGSTSESNQGELVVVGRDALQGTQLKFASWEMSSGVGRLLSVGIDSLDFFTFRELLAAANVGMVIDIRHLASFRGRGFTVSRVEQAFDELGVQYCRCLELANGFAGTSQNPHVILERYSEHLRSERVDVLASLAERLRGGTMLLLGREEAHFGSEREVIVRLLAEMRLHIELAIVTRRAPDGELWRWTTMVLGEEKPFTKSQRRRRPANKKRKRTQLSLPDVGPRKK